VVSTQLLNRETFQPATTLNVLAACWIQFENHDWFSHGDNSPTDFIEVKLEQGDPWGGKTMKIRETRDPEAIAKDTPPAYVNTATHWWDGSQIYGSSEERCRKLRTGDGGKLRIEDGRLPNEDDPELDGIDLTGFSDNYWAGLFDAPHAVRHGAQRDLRPPARLLPDVG
jgi:hypothetical protein